MSSAGVVRTEGVVGGAWRVDGTRVTVAVLKSLARAGFTVERLMKEYPSLLREQIEAALAFEAPPGEPGVDSETELANRELDEMDRLNAAVSWWKRRADAWRALAHEMRVRWKNCDHEEVKRLRGSLLAAWEEADEYQRALVQQRDRARHPRPDAHGPLAAMLERMVEHHDGCRCDDDPNVGIKLRNEARTLLRHSAQAEIDLVGETEAVRERIVAWLREQGTPDSQPRDYANQWADAIEDGAHLHRPFVPRTQRYAGGLHVFVRRAMQRACDALFDAECRLSTTTAPDGLKPLQRRLYEMRCELGSSVDKNGGVVSQRDIERAEAEAGQRRTQTNAGGG